MKSIRLALLFPIPLVRNRHRVEVAGGGVRVVDPFAEQPASR